MFGKSWCDIDDDLGLDGIPELPPLDFEPAFSAPVSPEKSATRESEDTSTAGSALDPDDKDESSPKETARSFASSRWARDFKSSPSQPKVCFIGNFPPSSGVEDFRQFVNLKGVSVTEIRLGPRKKTNSISFGYVDLESEADFHKLLAEDGTLYQGRKIRIDQATPHNKKAPRGNAIGRKSHHHFGRKASLRGRVDLRRVQSAPVQRHKTAGGKASRFLMNRSKTGGPRNFNKRSSKVSHRRQTRSGNFKRSQTTTSNSSTRFNSEGENSRFGRRA